MTSPEKTQQILHTLNKTNSSVSLNAQLSHSIAEGDSIVLIENGVYQCLNLSDSSSDHWASTAEHIYVLSADAKARGIQIDSIKHSKVAVINYKEFVQLTLKYKKVISWY